MWQRDLDSLISQNNESNCHGLNGAVLREVSGSFPVGLCAVP